MELAELLKAKRSEILQIAARHGASNLRMFGSVARGEAGPESDVDLIVTLADDRSLLDLIGLWQDLEDLLESNVDVVTDAGLHAHIREQVLQEAVAL